MESFKAQTGMHPVSFRPEWDKLPLSDIMANMQDYRPPGSMEEYQREFDTVATERSNTKICRVPPQRTSHKELNRIIRAFYPFDYISFILLPNGVGYPTHTDRRGCNINFVRAPAAPITLDGTTYTYDRFFMNPALPHSVEAHEVGRFTMMITWDNDSYEDILPRLRRNGWL